MDGFFSFFGKLTLFVLIVGLLVGGGYYLGKGKLPTFTYTPPNAVTTTAPTDTPTPTVSTMPTASPSSAPQTKTTIAAGVASGLSFSMYTIDVPTSWTVTHDQQTTPTPMDTVTIAKGDYKIKIYQAATGGAMCVYPGDPAPEGPASTFGPYVTIHGGDGKVYRRAVPTTGGTYTLCQNSQYGWGAPTPYGHISYSAPANPNEATLQEMDAIIATLKKKV